MTASKTEQSIAKKELEDYIIQLLQSKGEMTTKEIQEHFRKNGLSCPDESVRYLNRLRVKGLIQGRISVEHKGWVWWT
ncbi:hypothetical protein [[Eubacterium] cellulosolvens]